MVRMITHKLSSDMSQNPRIVSAIEICRELRHAGFEAWWVGGCVRDFLLEPQKIPSDIDVTTNASLTQIQAVFPHVISIGRAFGVGLLKLGEFSFEIATFRKESEYTDRRHPSQVGPGSMEEDSQRRDFTINALYFDPLSQRICDFHGGLDDIEHKLIRCVGNARDRLFEDPLRIFRLFRFAANLNLTIETSSMDAAQELVGELKFVSKERFLLEISKVKPHALNKFAQFARAALFHLIGAPLVTDVSHSSHLELTADAFHFPGTLLALMYYRQCTPSDSNWATRLSDWPLTLEEKSHLDLMQRVSLAQFSIPKTNDECALFLSEMRWLSKQNRTKVCDAGWIFESTPTQNNQDNSFLKLLLPLFKHVNSQATLGQAFELLVSSKAKSVRKELQIWATNKSPEVLGWARLISEVVILMDLCAVPLENRPKALISTEAGHLQSLYELAEELSRQKAKRHR